MKALGPSHAEYLKTKNNMAICLMNMNELEQALQLFKEVAEVQLKTLGCHHVEYLKTKHIMAVCFMKMKM